MASESRFVRRIASVLALDREDRHALGSLLTQRTEAAAGVVLICEHEPIDYGYVFEDGWGCRYKILEDGRRQILNFVIPGDYVGTSGALIQAADYSVSALTAVELRVFPSAALLELGERMPRLKSAFEWSSRRDIAILQERIVDIGRRSAYERTAHLVLELHHRLGLVGLAHGTTFDMPLTQEMLADALGLTVVHVNRTLRKLRESGALRFAGGRITITDREALIRIAEFDESYLHHAPIRGRPVTRSAS